MPAYPPMPSRLETARLTLRPWSDSDAEGHSALFAERGAGPLPVERSREIIAAQLAAAASTGIALLPVDRRDTGAFLGYVGRASLDEPEIAYELFRSAHGHGYATEAACAVLAAASTTGRGRVWATVRTWNAPSFRVLEKLGFERDHVSADDRGELVWLTRALPRARRSA